MKTFDEIREAADAISEGAKAAESDDCQDTELHLAAEIARGALDWATECRSKFSDQFERLIVRLLRNTGPANRKTRAKRQPVTW